MNGFKFETRYKEYRGARRMRESGPRTGVEQANHRPSLERIRACCGYHDAICFIAKKAGGDAPVQRLGCYASFTCLFARDGPELCRRDTNERLVKLVHADRLLQRGVTPTPITPVLLEPVAPRGGKRPMARPDRGRGWLDLGEVDAAALEPGFGRFGG